MIKDKVSDRAKIWLRRFAALAGVEISAYSGSFSLHRDRLLKVLQVGTAIDVGAHVGQFAAQVRSGGFRGTIVSLEPNPDSYAELKQLATGDSSWHAIPVAAGASAGSMTLNVSANGQSSSLLRILPMHTNALPDSVVTATREVPVRRLDDVIGEFGEWSSPYAIKLDVQGFEMRVLEGASTLLVDTVIIEAELSLVELYAGAPPWYEVVEFLRERGFSLADVSRVFHDSRSGRLLQIDGLFIRDGLET